MENNKYEEELFQIASKFFYSLDPAHDSLHTRRVMKNAKKIGEAEGANMKIAIAASALHDIGRAQEQRTKIPHEIWGAEKAEKILAQRVDFSEEEIKGVCACILEHRSSSGECSSLESQVLYDADKLDSIGIVGLCRTFAFSGVLHQPFYNEELELSEDEENYKERVANSVFKEDYTAYEEFKRKLCRVKDSMLTKTGKRLARNRHSTMCHAIDLFRAEVRGDI